MPEAARSQRGVALLIAVLATALLTVTVLEFTYSSQVAYRRAAHWLDAQRARLAAESGIALAVEVLVREGEYEEFLKERHVSDSAKTLDPRLWMHCSEPGPWSCNREIDAQCTQYVDSPDAATGAESVARDLFTVRISDETGLYNLNRLAEHQTPDEADRVAQMFRLAGVDPALVGPIADWADTNSTPFTFSPGAEASEYAAQGRDTPPRNAQFATFRELALVLGVDADGLRKLRQVATVLPKTLDKVNVNTAPLPVLQSIAPGWEDEGLLTTLHAQRCDHPFANEADMKARVPQLAKVAVPGSITYASTWFRVRSTARIGDSTQSVEALLSRDGKHVEPEYLLVQRGANIANIDSPLAASSSGPPAAGANASPPASSGTSS